MNTSTPPPPTVGLRHLTLVVADLAACVAFYVKVLGFRVERQPDARAELRLADVGLTLLAYSPVSRDEPHLVDDGDAFHQRRGQHLGSLGLVVDRPEDVDAWAVYLRASGVDVLHNPVDDLDGTRSVSFHDPDANRVQIIHRPARAG